MRNLTYMGLLFACSNCWARVAHFSIRRVFGGNESIFLSKNNFKREITRGGNGNPGELCRQGIHIQRALIKICLHNRILQGFTLRAACREHTFVKLRFRIFQSTPAVISLQRKGCSELRPWAARARYNDDSVFVVLQVVCRRRRWK